MNDIIFAFFLSVVVYAVPLLLASLAGLASEKSGVINIALEGKMLSAACIAAILGQATGNPWLSLAGGIAGAMAISLLHAWLTQGFGMDHVISGMGLNALALGGTAYLADTATALKSMTKVPVLPEWMFWVLAGLAAVGFHWFLGQTRGGLRLNAVGNNPDKARTTGIDPVAIRWKALAATGLLCGVAGMLIAATAGTFSKDMTSGRGYIALAALILSGWRPLPALGWCLLFSLFNSLQLLFQGQGALGAAIPSEAWQAMPYAATLLALALVVQSSKAPAGLGKP